MMVLSCMTHVVLPRTSWFQRLFITMNNISFIIGATCVSALKSLDKDRRQTFPVYVMKEYIWGVLWLHLFLTSAPHKGECSTSRPGRSISTKITPVPIEYEVGLASEPIWTFWSRENPLAHAGIRTAVCPARSLVTTPTTLFQLSKITGLRSKDIWSYLSLRGSINSRKKFYCVVNRIWSEDLQIFKGERRSVCFLGISSPRKFSVGFVIMQETCLEVCGWRPYNALQWSSELEFRRCKTNKIKLISFSQIQFYKM